MSAVVGENIIDIKPADSDFISCAEVESHNFAGVRVDFIIYIVNGERVADGTLNGGGCAVEIDKHISGADCECIIAKFNSLPSRRVDSAVKQSYRSRAVNFGLRGGCVYGKSIVAGYVKSSGTRGNGGICGD